MIQKEQHHNARTVMGDKKEQHPNASPITVGIKRTTP